ncbi:probable LRR receptor-like serine/threonine-protein kinase At1g56140 isoform X2 [Musa acuminata AAA Group]|uniref:probable LRR receptor-like serine/threonine-protein kinase At1g56140 isoform X2 n=1 Tax=Musa acuminata AAA Group TaxID=214697 RepID=UPI0031DCA4AE
MVPQMRFFIFLFAFVFSIITPGGGGLSYTNATEKEALRNIQKRWRITTWETLLSIDPCDPLKQWRRDGENAWINCSCDPNDNCSIIELKVFEMNVSGTIPDALFNLTNLVNLNLSRNILNGSIPEDIHKLKRLRILSLDKNQFSGNITPSIGNLTNLTYLSLGTNRFSGSIPSTVGSLTLLEQLYIDSSGLSGPLPSDLKNMTSLKTLWAFDNDFTGNLPESIGQLTNLTDLQIYGTFLEGPIPKKLSALTKLETLKLGDLSGADSNLSFLENMKSLFTLSLRNCQVADEIPAFLANFSNLTYLDLSFNKLHGSIPNLFGKLATLRYLFLGNNVLSDLFPSEVLTENKKLTTVDVSFNNISGSLSSSDLREELSMNYIGTSMNKQSDSQPFLKCIEIESSPCTSNNRSAVGSFSVNCGGKELSLSGIDFFSDTTPLGMADFYISSNHRWAVSSSQSFISKSNGSNFIVNTDEPMPKLYQTARISTRSLRYYVVGLQNGTYKVELFFAEIVMDDTPSWTGLGRRIFNIYIQNQLVEQDFNIIAEAKGSKKPYNKTYKITVANNILDIHLLWSGRGTCCIPAKGTYGPLVSAINVTQEDHFTPSPTSSSHNERRAGIIVGIAAGCAAAVIILSSIVYLWWKRIDLDHVQVCTNTAKQS